MMKFQKVGGGEEDRAGSTFTFDTGLLCSCEVESFAQTGEERFARRDVKHDLALVNGEFDTQVAS